MAVLIFETCCASAADVAASAAAGADRAELNSALELGGLTPTGGTLELSRELAPDIRIMSMIRPRQGGFCYSEAEFKTMMKDAEKLLKAGADGIVFGILNSDGTVDRERCRELVALAGDREKVFHRAMDVVPDWREALDVLAELGFNRVLTSGQAASAPEGTELIRLMREYSAGRIGVLPGAGVRPENASELLKLTGCRQLHMSVRKKCVDMPNGKESTISFGKAGREEYTYEQMDRDGLKKAIEKLRKEWDAE